MAIWNVFKREFWSQVRGFGYGQAIIYAWPFVVAGVALLGGWIQGFPPLPYLVAAVSLTFMAVAVGVFAVGATLFQENPEGKLAISGVIFARRYAAGGGRKLLGIKYGIHHQTIARFPIEFSVKPVQASLGASFNPKPNRTVTGGIAKMGVPGVFYEAEVPVVERDMKGRLVEGKYELEISYGRPGNLKFKMTKEYLIYIQFGNNGDTVTLESCEIR